MLKKFFLICVILLGFLLLAYYLFFSTSREERFVGCLRDANVIIYGSDACPVCIDLVEDLGGRRLIDGLYVDCIEDFDRCLNEMQGEMVPEVRVAGKSYEGVASIEELEDLTGCNF